MMAFDNQKITLCWPNLIDDCTLASTANYLRPLNRIQQRVLKDQMITDDLDFSFEMALDQQRSVGAIALFAHNLSVDAQWRIRLYDDQDNVLQDSGFIAAWPALYNTSEMNWETDEFWSGDITDADRTRFTPQSIWLADKAWYVAKVVIDIDDAANADSVIKIGRVFVSDVFQPLYNASYGIGWQHTDTSIVDAALDGTEYFDLRPLRRECSFALDWLNEAEGFGRIFRMRRDIGITGELLFAQQLQRDTTFLQRTMLCRAAQSDPINHPDSVRYTHALTLTEIL